MLSKQCFVNMTNFNPATYICVSFCLVFNAQSNILHIVKYSVLRTKQSQIHIVCDRIAMMIFKEYALCEVIHGSNYKVHSLETIHFST